MHGGCVSGLCVRFTDCTLGKVRHNSPHSRVENALSDKSRERTFENVPKCEGRCVRERFARESDVCCMTRLPVKSTTNEVGEAGARETRQDGNASNRLFRSRTCCSFGHVYKNSKAHT
jgi:hypothetical protein